MSSVKPSSPRTLTIVCLNAFLSLLSHHASGAALLPNTNGDIEYVVDAQGNRVPDFSYAGYHAGGTSLPVHTRNVVVVNNTPGDDTSAIQSAINTVSTAPLVNGHRGVVYLGAGTWNVSARLNVAASGVVVRGAGMGTTTLVSSASDVITFNYFKDSQFRQGIATAQPLVGDVRLMDTTVQAANGTSFNAGDEVCIYQSTTQAWIDSKQGGGVTDKPQWTTALGPLGLDRIYLRTIISKSGNWLTLDAPIYDHLLQSLAPVQIFKHDNSGFTYENGLEHLSIVSTSTATNTYAVRFFQCVDFWATAVRVSGWKNNGIIARSCRRGTWLNVHSVANAVPPDSGKNYCFTWQAAQQILIDTFTATGLVRHGVIGNGSALDSGNVAVRGSIEYSFEANENHQKWGQSTLFDNLHHTNLYKGRIILLGNRGDSGESHGWSNTHSVAYRITSEHQGSTPATILLNQPPGGQNYAIACDGLNITSSGHFPVGEPLGAVQPGSPTLPLSLYDFQLQRRLSGPPPLSTLAVDTTNHDFGLQVIGTSRDYTFTITNSSDYAASGTAFVAAPFSIVSGDAYTIAPHSSTSLTIRYAPVSPGAHTASLSLDEGNTVAASMSGIACRLQESLIFDATGGTIIAPMSDFGDYIAQTNHTLDTIDAGGAVYAVNISSAGPYKLVALVDAPSSSTDSFFVAMDSHPHNPQDIWDVLPLTSGFEVREIAARGSNGTFTSPQYAPATWNLAVGTHFVVIQGREMNARIRSLAIVPANSTLDTLIPTKPSSINVSSL